MVWLLAALCALLTSAAAGTVLSRSPTPSATGAATLAPADEYFGHEKLSVLVIRHEALALKDALHHQRRQPDQIAHDADGVFDAFMDWTKRFPRDPWQARTGWEIATLYEELPGTGARDRAVSLLQFIRDHYGGTSFAADSIKDLQRGIGVRPWPQSAHVQVAASPHPAATVLPPLVARVLEIKSDVEAKRITPDDALKRAVDTENDFRQASHNGDDAAYTRCAWEIAALY